MSGNFVVLNELIVTTPSSQTSMRDNDGCCIRNGQSGNANATNAMMFIGGKGNLDLDGGLENNGSFYIESSKVSMNEHSTKDTMYFRNIGEIYDQNFYTRRNTDSNTAGKWDAAPRFTVQGGDNSVTHFAGEVSCTAGLLTGVDSVLSVEGNLYYGMAILNGGTMYIKGSVDYSTNHWKKNGIEILWNEAQGAKGMYSIVNGYKNVGYGNGGALNSAQNADAYFYCGGALSTGDPSAHNGGTIQNWGSMYVNGDMDIYGSEGTTVNKIGFHGAIHSKTLLQDTLSAVTVLLPQPILCLLSTATISQLVAVSLVRPSLLQLPKTILILSAIHISAVTVLQVQEVKTAQVISVFKAVLGTIPSFVQMLTFMSAVSSSLTLSSQPVLI